MMRNDRRARIRDLIDRLSSDFIAAGALPIETDSLLPADVLLDLYGEDIRARAYVTQDPMRGEQMLRPDFTVPIVQRHMAEGAEPARYTYNGTIWRKQAAGSEQAQEYQQVGYELFDRSDAARADAEVFALFHGLLAEHDLRIATGDMGILLTVIDGLTTSARRKAALRRHLWRPARFRALLDRYAGKSCAPEHTVDLMVQIGVKGLDVVLEEAGPAIGLRSREDIVARIETLQEEAKTAPLPGAEADLLDAVMALGGSADRVLEDLRDIAAEFAPLQSAVQTMQSRHDALDARGIDPASLQFDVSYGRTTLEYYDGFVFGFATSAGTVVASGGRYDALTRVLGQGRSIAAVGGVVRPEALLGVMEGAS